MFEVGVKGSGLLGCLYCVKDCESNVLCDTRHCHIGSSDGHSDIAFCSNCHLGDKNIICHKCSDELAYAPNGFEHVKTFCQDCMSKVRALKKKKKNEKEGV